MRLQEINCIYFNGLTFWSYNTIDQAAQATFGIA